MQRAPQSTYGHEQVHNQTTCPLNNIKARKYSPTPHRSCSNSMKTSKRAREHTYQIVVKWSTLSHLRYNLCHPVAKLLIDSRIHQKAFWTGTVLTHILKNTTTRQLVPARSGHQFISGIC